MVYEGTLIWNTFGLLAPPHGLQMQRWAHQMPFWELFGITEAYKRDTNPKKVNVGDGAYRDDQVIIVSNFISEYFEWQKKY